MEVNSVMRPCYGPGVLQQTKAGQLECLSSTSFTMKPEDKQRTEQHQEFTKTFDAVPHNVLRKLLKQVSWG